jgi:hypothetical protein
MASGKLDAEKEIKRNPHGDFKAVEASRPPFEANDFHYTQTPKPSWKPGSGANDPSGLEKNHREIDPYGEGRAAVLNYKMLISAVVPRPVGFTSTISADGKSTNLAPFSYFTLVNHDPPIFVLGFAGGMDKAKDTLKNLLETTSSQRSMSKRPTSLPSTLLRMSQNGRSVDYTAQRARWSSPTE